MQYFGPEEGKLTVAPGHQEVEIGLVKLYRATGDRRHLDLSKFFLDARVNMTSMTVTARISSEAALTGRIIKR